MSLEDKALEYLAANKPEPPKRPTIAELQAILDSAETIQDVEINPDGSIGVEVSKGQARLMAEFASKKLEEAASIVENEPLGYRTEDEHEKLESFADRVGAKILLLIGGEARVGHRRRRDVA